MTACSIGTYCLFSYSPDFSVTFVLVADAEVAADGERILLDLGLEFDLGRTLRLALNPLRTRRSRACRFARRAAVFQLAVKTRVARHAHVFQLAVRTRAALRALIFPLSMRAPLSSNYHRTITTSCVAAPLVLKSNDFFAGGYSFALFLRLGRAEKKQPFPAPKVATLRTSRRTLSHS